MGNPRYDSEPITVAGCQIRQDLEDREANLRTAVDAIRSQPDHEIYVLPELSSSGYGVSAFRRLEATAESWDGPSFERFSEVSKDLGCHICYSFPRRRGDDGFTIAAAVVGPDGEIVVRHDKWHVCGTGESGEQTYFEAGKRPLETFEVRGVRVGLCICYDIRFPELVRQLAVRERISLLLHPVAWPRDEGFFTWHTFVTTRAVENTIYVMSTNWAGANNGATFFCPPFVDGDRLRSEELGIEEGILVGRVDPEHLRNIRGRCTYLADRNVEMYADESEWLVESHSELQKTT